MAKKQPELPEMTGKGVAPVHIAAIDKLADKYIEARDNRMEGTKEEVAAKLKLIEALRANADKLGADPNGVIIYRYDTMVVTLEPGKEKLKVRDESDTEDSESDLS